MKVKVVCRKVYDYIRYDLKEIAFPSSLPDPPHIKKRRKLTLHERFLYRPYCCAFSSSESRNWPSITPKLKPSHSCSHSPDSNVAVIGEAEMKVKVVCRKVYDYIRYDLKEIAFPSSLPDPPHIKKRRKLTLHERFLVLKEASRLYAASWVRDIGPDLRPNDYKNAEESEDKPNGAKSTTKEKEPSTLEDLAVAARGGMETLRPALQRVYMTRASAYRDALKSFIEGYQEGIQKTMEMKDSKSNQEGDKPDKST